MLALNKAESDRNHSERVSEVGAEELTARVIQAWYRAYLSEKGIAVQRASQQATEKLVAAVRAKYANDLASSFDVEQAELNAARSRQSVKDAESLLEQDLDKLKMLLGLNPEDRVDFDFSLLSEDYPSSFEPLVEELQQMALNHRLEIIAMKESRDFALQRMEIITRRVGPPIDLSIHYALVGQGDSLDDTLEVDDRRVGLGLNVSTDFALATEKTSQGWLCLNISRLKEAINTWCLQLKAKFAMLSGRLIVSRKISVSRKNRRVGRKALYAGKKEI